MIVKERLRYLCCDFEATIGDEAEVVKQWSKKRLLILIDGCYHKVKASSWRRATGDSKPDRALGLPGK